MILGIFHDITTDRTLVLEAAPERVTPAPPHNFLFTNSLDEKRRKIEKLFISDRARATGRIRITAIIHDITMDRSLTQETAPERVTLGPLHNFLFKGSLRQK